MVIPQRGKRSNKEGRGKTDLTPDLLWLALRCVVCGEGMEECLFICFLHPHFLRWKYWNLNQQPLVTSLAFLTSGLLPRFILDQPLDSALIIWIVKSYIIWKKYNIVKELQDYFSCSGLRAVEQ